MIWLIITKMEGKKTMGDNPVDQANRRKEKKRGKMQNDHVNKNQGERKRKDGGRIGVNGAIMKNIEATEKIMAGNDPFNGAI